ncbi:hypothetical protein Tco_1130003 [Tanacetum coccineum]
MSDSDDSIVTYTAAPPSLDYVPGLEEPEQAPPLPEFVPELVYPEFMPPEDDVLPAEEQPLPAAVSPTADSPGYIPESDPEEDPEEDDDEDPEEDPADYPIDRDDDDEDPKEDPANYPTDRDDEEEEEEEEPSSDKVDDEEEDEDDQEKEEHPASADSISPSVHRIPSPPLPVSPHLPVSPPPLPVSPTYPLGYKASMIQLRAETPSTSHPLPSSTPPSGTPPLLPIPLPTSSPLLLLPSTVCRAGVFKVTLLPRKRLCITLGLRYKVGESSSAPTTRPTRGLRADYGFVGTLDDEIR